MQWATEYIKLLKNGKTVKFRPFGNSMSGLIESGQLVTVKPPVLSEIKIGSIVLCEVSGKQYLHLVKEIYGDNFMIGNNLGKINGWIQFDNIHGILIKIEK